jgi:CDP-6-deoxy-D-xylo-4-hexulose-3-dehydrase
MDIRDRILALTKEYILEQEAKKHFVPGETYITPAGQMIDADDVVSLVDTALGLRYAEGEKAQTLEKKLREFVGIRCASLCNSGSSANLLALSALTSRELSEPLRRGNKILTLACGFPTTVNPIIQNGMIPVFLDVELGTYLPNMNRVLEVLRRDPTIRGVMMAHTLGNPIDFLPVIENFPDLWIIEDCCDALGSTIHGKHVGKLGAFSTLSLYPAHIMTTTEGGTVFTSQPKLRVLVESLRDWGRDCWCDPGKENTCGKRFEWLFEKLPVGYDHKYIYTHVGYNLKISDLHASIGLGQVDRLPEFILTRRYNHHRLTEGLKKWQDFLILPEAAPNSNPSWFGFAITVKPPINCREISVYLESKKIGTRRLFGGNLTRQPMYQSVPYEIAGNLENSDRVMNDTIWIGVWPGINDSMIDYILDCFEEYFRGI